MSKLGISVLSFACIAGLGVGCGNVKYPKSKAKPATVTETPQNPVGILANKSPAKSPNPAPVPANSTDLNSLSTSLNSVQLSMSHAGTQVSLSFSHLSADKIQSDGLPSVIHVANLSGEIDPKNPSVVLQDPAAPDYSAKLVCTDGVDCRNWIIDLTLKSGKQAGTAKIRAESASGLALGVVTQGELKEELEKTFESQSKSSLPKISSASLYRVEGGKTFFNARTEIKPDATDSSAGSFEKRVLILSGALGKNVSVQFSELLKPKSGPAVTKSLLLEADVDFSATPFSLSIKPRRSGLVGIEYKVSPISEEISGSAVTQTKPTPPIQITR